MRPLINLRAILLITNCNQLMTLNFKEMAKFEVYQSGKKNEYRFRLKTKNGQIILSSEGYTPRAACINGIDSVALNAANVNIVDIKN